MKLEGKISILISREYTTIEIEDDTANMTFARIKMTPEQLSAALSRQACVDCELEVRGLDKVGKTHENKSFVFEIDKDMAYHRRDEDKLREIAQSLLTDGWIADGYFGSKNSFFKKDGKQYARCTIRRWVSAV